MAPRSSDSNNRFIWNCMLTRTRRAVFNHLWVAACTLPRLFLMEKKTLARTQECVKVLELLPFTDGTTGDWAVRGRADTVSQQGPEAIVRALPNVAAALDTQVTFMGPATDLAATRQDPQRRARIERIFAVDWAKVAIWLRALKTINPMYHDIDIDPGLASDEWASVVKCPL